VINRSPLRHIKLTKYAPSRDITPFKQYEEIVTLEENLSNNKISGHIEFPTNRRIDVKNLVISKTSQPNHKQSTKSPIKIEITNFVKNSNPNRSKFLTFMFPLASVDTVGQARSQEYYSLETQLNKNENNKKSNWLRNLIPLRFQNHIQSDIPVANMRYIRYGETPYAMGPNQKCVVELTGSRYDEVTASNLDVMKTLSLIQECSPSFLSRSILPGRSSNKGVLGNASTTTSNSHPSTTGCRSKIALLHPNFEYDNDHSMDPLIVHTPWYKNIYGKIRHQFAKCNE
jgi:hypothetical protein